MAAGSVGAAVAAGLLSPGQALADWNAAAFESKDVNAALKGLLGSDAIETSEAVVVKAPDIAENGAVVPVTVETELKGVKSISIIAAGNGTPLIASFTLGAAALPYISTRIKMAKTADVIGVVQQGDKLLSNAKNVKVTIGGCGG